VPVYLRGLLRWRPFKQHRLRVAAKVHNHGLGLWHAAMTAPLRWQSWLSRKQCYLHLLETELERLIRLFHCDVMQ